MRCVCVCVRAYGLAACLRVGKAAVVAILRRRIEAGLCTIFRYICGHGSFFFLFRLSLPAECGGLCANSLHTVLRTFS